MKCWSEGDLRAYIDRELQPEEMERIAAHLEKCSECGDRWAEVAGRASRVSALMSGLGHVEPAVRVVPMPRRANPSWRWAGVAAALAAGLAIGIVVLPKRGSEVAVVAPQPAPVAQTAVSRPEPDLPVVSLAAGTPAKLAPARRPKRPSVPVALPGDRFLALDNDPIETGVVLRVALGPREIPADVIIDSDGRPRAIRLVNLKTTH